VFVRLNILQAACGAGSRGDHAGAFAAPGAADLPHGTVSSGLFPRAASAGSAGQGTATKATFGSKTPDVEHPEDTIYGANIAGDVVGVRIVLTLVTNSRYMAVPGSNSRTELAVPDVTLQALGVNGKPVLVYSRAR
jgi:hypothetical protein